MNYNIEIEGGFTGIPEQLRGEMVLEPEKSGNLIRILRESEPQINNKDRDMLIYNIALEDGSVVAQSEFTDRSLPMELRKFINDIKNNSRP